MTLALTLNALALALALVALVVVCWHRRPLTTAPRLTGQTVVLERAGHDVVNVRGIVVAQHADRWTLDEAQAIGPEGDVPLEHPVIHVPTSVVLSVSPVTES